MTLNVITCVTNGIPSKNSMKQIPAVNSIFFCRKYSGNSSTKAVVIVSNIPNWTERKIIVSFLFQTLTEIKVLKYNVQEKILAVLVKCLVLYFLFYRKWKIFIIFIFRLRSHLALIFFKINPKYLKSFSISIPFVYVYLDIFKIMFRLKI